MLEKYLDETVTSRKIPFTFEGIEKLKAIRAQMERETGIKYPLPTVIHYLICLCYQGLQKQGVVDDIPEQK